MRMLRLRNCPAGGHASATATPGSQANPLCFLTNASAQKATAPQHPQNRPCSEVRSATQTMPAFQEGQSVCFPIWQGLLPPSSMHLLLDGKLSIQMTNRPCLGQQEENKAGGRRVQDLIRNVFAFKHQSCWQVSNWQSKP